MTPPPEHPTSEPDGSDAARVTDAGEGLPAPSAAQRRLWFVAQLEGDSGTYNVPVAVSLKGPLDADALDRALAHMVERHEALAYCFPARNGEPALAFTRMPVRMARVTAPEGGKDALDRLTRAEAEKPFDLERGPLFRPTLITIAPDDHLLVLNCHHIVIDDWSVGILLRDLGKTYDAFRAGKPAPLPPLPFRFADHLRRVEEEGNPFLEDQLAYWREQLDDAPALLPLPTDHPRPKVQRFVGDRHTFFLPEDTAEGLRQTGRRLGATLFMTTLAGFGLFLSRYARQTDLVVGIPIAHRSTREAEGLVGFFVNILPLRLDLTGRPCFTEMVKRVRSVFINAIDNVDVPFESLVETLRPVRSTSHTPIFQVMFDLLADSFDSLSMDGLEVSYRALNSGTSKYDLTVSFKETASGMLGAFEYSTDLFEPATIDRMIGHLSDLLAACVAAPDVPADTLPMLRPPEAVSLLAAAGAETPLDPAPFVSFPARFAEMACRTPEAEALVQGSRRLTYAALDTEAGRLARRLRRLGAGPGALVAVVLEHGAEAVIALLAVHRIGAVFMPLGASDGRAAEVIGDTVPLALMTTAALASRFAGTGVPVMAMDGSDGEAPAAGDDEAAVPTVTETDPAYVIHTSGSTGKPKGVRVSHGALASAMAAWRRVYDLDSPDFATLEMAAFTFDVFIGDVTRTLGAGGRLVICPRETLLDPAALHRLIEDETIRFAEFVPGVLRELIGWLEQSGGRLSAPQTIVCGSDVWFMGEYRRLRALCPAETRIFGSYGVTEATVDSALIDPGTLADLADDAPVPLGRPLPNTELHIVDPDLALTPAGVPGELVIAGQAVADGYLNRPDLTAERFPRGRFTEDGRFRPDPSGPRLYRTGDLCRRDETGGVRFLGRLDHQVKIRGFRIEPGEVERVLADHPHVREAAVVPLPGGAGGLELVAYALGQASAETLKAFMAARLPPHMVPAHVVLLEAFPRTASGKLKRSALPAPDRAAGRAAAVPPRTATETAVAALWAEVLGLEPAGVGVFDDFFSLGGHSLAAARLVARLRTRFGCLLPLSALFEGPTIAALAEALEVLEGLASSSDAAPVSVLSIPEASASERRRLSHAQRRLWLATRVEGTGSAYNMPDARRLRGPLDGGALERALGDVVARHETVRCAFSATVEPLVLADGRSVEEPLLTILPPGPVPLVRADAAECDLPALLGAEGARPFDLSQGPLIRGLLLRLGPEDHVLCVTTHHIVSDGWSVGVFWRDLAACYAARLGEQTAAPPPALSPCYSDYAAWQRDRLARTEDDLLAYWAGQLADPPAPLDLRTPTPAVPRPEDEGARLAFRLPADLAGRLKTRAEAWRCTPFMVMHAAFALLLHRYSGQEDLVIGSPVAGRTHPDLEPLIGFFVNMLPLRLTVRDSDTVEAVIQRARRTCLEAIEYQDLPFDLLVERLNPERGTGRAPLFQVGLVWEEGATGDAVFPGLTASAVAVPHNWAKLDLVLSLGGTDGADACLAYRTSLFDQTTIAGMRDHLLTLLDGLLRDGERSQSAPASALPMLPLAETRRLLHDWNDTTIDRPAEMTLTAVIGAVARTTPARAALEFCGRTWSYGALDRLSDYMAGALLEAGVVPGSLVGLFTGRHPHLVIGMLGILKAGCGYVPLDPDDPGGHWTRQVLEDAALCAVVAGAGLAEQAAGLGLPVVTVPDTASEAMKEIRPLPAVMPSDRAYVIFTSGSTGRPKGVAVSHRAICNTTLAFVRCMRLDASARHLQFFSPVFDGVGAEVFPTLAAGATLVFGVREAILPGPDLARFLADARISHLLVTPSALRLLPPGPLPELRVIMVAGEACPPDLARDWATGRAFLNGYGPTETAICASATEYWEERGRLILRPFENTTLDVLDDVGRLLPVGLAGELCIGGMGLADGYLGQPERTARAFIADPHRPGRRLYRSGDRVRRLADGTLEFLGRDDRQVKVRGFRVELDEVAAGLGALPGVTEAAVVAQSDACGQKRLVAYLAGSLDREAARAAARAALPPAMVPERFVILPALPKSAAGKIDHRALSDPGRENEPAGPLAISGRAGPTVRPSDRGMDEAVAALWREVLGHGDFGPDDNFFDAGGHSLHLAMLHRRLVEGRAPDLRMTDLFQYPTVRGLARFLGGGTEAQETARPAGPVAAAIAADEPIAVIGMAGRFPGAGDLATFWRHLHDGIDVTTDYSDEELLARGIAPEMLAHPAFVRRGLPLEDADRFDAGFFGFSPKEARLTDPQQRLFLEGAWAALEDAGYGDRDEPARSVGVFASCSISHYLLDNIHPNRQALGVGPDQWVIGNDKDFLATRVAYKLNLRGPAVSVGTACSSSLVALHLACESLRRGDCAMALAGGVSLDADRVGYLAVEGGILSPSGRCRPFDAAADGTTSGSGMAAVVLKPLSAALADGDTVRAVVLGTGVNNDGADKVSYTAPSLEGQVRAIRRALDVAGVSPDTIGYVETHGTGTHLGDPIEVRALTRAYAAGDAGRPVPLVLGALKASVGHLDTAAGLAGLVKTVLALEAGVIPPTPGFSTPNPEIDFASGNLVVGTEPRPWPETGTPRRAGVSSFGVGGTNVHAILEAPPPFEAPVAETDGRHILPLSARTPEALRTLARRLADHIGRHPDALADIAHTLQVGRTRLGLRAAAVGATAEAVRTQLMRIADGAVEGVAERRLDRPVVFLFPGQGSQHIGMARGLYARDPAFRALVDHGAERLAAPLGRDLRAVMTPADGEDPESAAALLDQTRHAQPALFVVEYALARRLMDLGIRPRAMIGHSLGELVAACVSGLIGLDDALNLVARRGTLMQAQPAGAMVAVEGTEAELRPYLIPGVEVAAYNGPTQHVLAGPFAAIAVVEALCQSHGRAHRRLRTSHAFHSALMDGAAEVLRAGDLPPPGVPEIPFISNRTGGWFDAADAADPAYWADHLRQPVRFAEGLRTLLAEGDPILLEVGPGGALRGMLRAEGREVLCCLSNIRESRDDETAFAEALAMLWLQGAAIDWGALHRGKGRRRVPLPPYPFRRDRHWLPAAGLPMDVPPALVRHWRADGAGRILVTLALPPGHWITEDHRLFDGQPTLPGTGCLELTRAAFAKVFKAERVELRDTSFPAPLIVGAGDDRRIELLFQTRTGTGGDGTAFTLRSRPVDGEDWTIHALGTILAHDRPVPAPLPMPLPEAEETADLEAFAWVLGPYGPRWHCFRSVFRAGDEAWARLRLTEGFAADCATMALHPALLDMATAFQSLWRVVRGEGRRGLVPFHYQRLTIHGALSPDIVVRGRAAGRDTYDVTLYGERPDGAGGTLLVPLVEVDGYMLREAIPATTDGTRPLEDWCQTVAWEPAPAAEGMRQTDAPWLIFAERLDGAPPGSLFVVPGPAFDRRGPDAWSLRPDSVEDHAALLEALEAEGRLPDHIVHAWSLEGATQGTVADAFASMLALVKPLGAMIRRPVLVSLVTRGLAGLPGDGTEDIAATGAAGVLRAVAWEFPEIRCRHIDLGAAADTEALLGELAVRPADPLPRGGLRIALRDGRRLAPCFPVVETRAGAAPLRAGGTYVITGGLGGIGLALARHIAETAEGSRLVLVGRSARPETAPQVEALKALGADVVVVAADVSSAEGVAQAMDTAHARFGPVSGVIHAAGVQAGGLIETQTAESARAVLAAKTLGTDRLIAAVRGDGPDFILLCSSLVTVYGGLGQADYAAANGYLEAAARHARAEGLPVTAVAWDAWAEVGMRVAHDRDQGRETGAADGLSTAEGCRLFERALSADLPVVVVSRAAPVDGTPDTGARRPGGGGAASVGGAAGTHIAPRTPLEEEIAALWEDLLGVTAPGVEDNFFDHGGHSLLGTQLVSRLRDRWGGAMTLAEFLETPTIAAIADAVEAHRAASSGEGAGAGGNDGPLADPDVRFCLVPVQSKGAGRPFFCLPGMGGNVSQMLPLANALGTERPFYGLQCLGLDGKRPPHESVEAMAEHYIRCIKAIQPQGPYLLGGHSLGGKVAYEMAWRLHQAGERVAHMALFDSAAPPYKKLPEPDDAQVLFTLLSIFGYYFGKVITLSKAEHQAVMALDLDAKLALLRDRLEAFDLIRPGSDPGTIRGLFNVYKAAGHFGNKYDPHNPPIPVPMTLYKAVDPMPPTVSLPEIRETPAWGWERFSTLPVALQEVPGDHFSCLTPAHVSAVAERLKRDLAAADGAAG